MKYQGIVKKLVASNADTVRYELPIGDKLLPLNELIGSTIEIEARGQIRCLNCEHITRKSFNQGYCYKCFISLARCDRCSTSPELCHYDKGTCREPKWGEENCFIAHTVYLANSSGLKIGITRAYQQVTRWIDQGAIQALPIGRVDSRLKAGQVEVVLKKHLSDKTNWRRMLSGDLENIDMEAAKIDILRHWPEQIKGRLTEKSTIYSFRYPVIKYPSKIVSHNLDKYSLLKDTLMGIKGQYLIFENTVINIRKYSGYELGIEVKG